MKYSVSDSEVRVVDNMLTITDLFKGKGFSFDCVIANLNGVHPTVINHQSDRMYFVLEGEGEVVVGENRYRVAKHDAIEIRKETTHSISGELSYLIITAPPFDPSNEDMI